MVDKHAVTLPASNVPEPACAGDGRGANGGAHVMGAEVLGIVDGAVAVADGVVHIQPQPYAFAAFDSPPVLANAGVLVVDTDLGPDTDDLSKLCVGGSPRCAHDGLGGCRLPKVVEVYLEGPFGSASVGFPNLRLPLEAFNPGPGMNQGCLTSTGPRTYMYYVGTAVLVHVQLQ